MGTSKPENQDQNFYNNIKNKINNLKPCLDIETTGYNIMNYVTRFISRFESLSNLPICIYVAPYYANQNLNSSLKKYPCWIANYGVLLPMATSILGTSYAGWQYSETGYVSGINGNVDMNYFYDEILIDNWKLGWNKNTKGWWYCTDVKNKNYYKSEWKLIDGQWYYFNNLGYALQSEWLKVQEKWYYLKDNCQMAKNEWIQYKNKWYYFDTDGVMQRGWIKLGGNWYYLYYSGEMATGWVKIGSNWYYLSVDGKMATDTTIDGWKIDSKGIATKI